MTGWSAALVAGVFLGAPTPLWAQQNAPLVLEPSSNWVLDYGDDYCALRRNFGDEGQQVLLELSQMAPGERFQVLVVSADLNTRRGRNINSRFDWQSVAQPQEQVATVVREGVGEGFIFLR